MRFYTFRLLSPVVQLYWIFRHGTFLASRWENEGGVNLYHCGSDGRGFFVEVGVEEEKPVVLRSFDECGTAGGLYARSAAAPEVAMREP